MLKFHQVCVLLIRNIAVGSDIDEYHLGIWWTSFKKDASPLHGDGSLPYFSEKINSSTSQQISRRGRELRKGCMQNQGLDRSNRARNKSLIGSVNLSRMAPAKLAKSSQSWSGISKEYVQDDKIFQRILLVGFRCNPNEVNPNEYNFILSRR